MISSLQGEVLEVGTNGGVISVGGVGFAFSATPNTLAQLHLGSQALVLTTLIVREDSLTLFAFSDTDERDVFNVLLGVSGIGAKTALATLAVLSPDQLRRALLTKDEKAICKVPGIGPKVAKRIILEIGEKLGNPRNNEDSASASASTTAGNNSPEGLMASHSDVLEALVNLGWHEREADLAVNQALERFPSGSITQLLRVSLQILGSRR